MDGHGDAYDGKRKKSPPFVKTKGAKDGPPRVPVEVVFGPFAAADLGVARHGPRRKCREQRKLTAQLLGMGRVLAGQAFSG